MRWNSLPVFAAAAVMASVVASSAQSPVDDQDIRTAFVGRAACPPKPWPVSFGPYEFRPDGTYFRMQDIASLHGRYTVAGGRICVSFTGPSPPDFCLEVLKTDAQYFFRYHGSPAPASPLPAYPVTPCPLPDHR